MMDVDPIKDSEDPGYLQSKAPYVRTILYFSGGISSLINSVLLRTRPDTRIPQHLGRSNEIKDITGRPRAICGQRYPLPCFE